MPRRPVVEGMKVDPRQLQKKFEHAADVGIAGSYNRTRAAAFEDALRSVVAATSTRRVVGSFRRTLLVVFYVNLESGLIVITDRDDVFISGWKLTEPQLTNVMERGTL